MNYRPLRMGQLIRDELGILLKREVEFPAGTLVTLTEVEVKKKLDHANVLISVLPSESSGEILKILNAASGDLRYKLLHKLNVKPLPRLHFAIDHGPENAAVVEKALLEQ